MWSEYIRLGQESSCRHETHLALKTSPVSSSDVEPLSCDPACDMESSGTESVEGWGAAELQRRLGEIEKGSATPLDQIQTHPELLKKKLNPKVSVQSDSERLKVTEYLRGGACGGELSIGMGAP